VSGIYIHIPYCKQACHYCDFHFSTQQKSSAQMHKAMLLEMKQMKNYFQGIPLQTIYFGGGSPSVISTEYISEFIEKTKELFGLAQQAEVTFEANPDDMNLENLKAWKQIGINRLSVGIQSFNDEDLKWMNRAHNSEQASESIEKAKEVGFDNISIDLIYGIPNQNFDLWKSNVQKAIELDVQHISAYCLTIETNTVFGKWKEKEQLFEKPDEKIENEFFYLKDSLENAGFDHYEISNFGKPSFYSKHNTSYWQGIPYLGIGPSAHSFSGNKREWNFSNNAIYLSQSNAGKIERSSETRPLSVKYNEYILTGLRTIWGINLSEIKTRFSIDLLKKFKSELDVNSSFLEIEKDIIRLNRKGLLMADRIASDLFLE